MKTLRALLLGTALLTPAGIAATIAGAGAARAATAPGPYQHVLLISIDGMHAIDLTNWFHNAHFGASSGPLHQLSLTATVYMNAYTSAPSDSFPGMIAQVTGATPKSSGVYYDDSYDRKLWPAGSNCTGPQGTEANYSEFIDKDSTRLDAGGTLGQPLTQINVNKLPMSIQPNNGHPTCKPVLPHQFLRVNTVFEQIHAQLPGAITAWSDKHPAYEILNGPSGTGIDDLYTPEINATANASAGTDYTQSYTDTQTYDAMKVQAVINQINGMDSTGSKAQAVPALFGMNFQSVSVGQKLAVSGPDDPAGLVGGYKTSTGGLNNALGNQLAFVDSQIGLLVSALKQKNLLNSTLIIISAKHGQAPINPKARVAVDPSAFPATANGTGTSVAFYDADDVGLLWLDPATRTTATYNNVKHQLDHYKTLKLHISTLLVQADMTAQYQNPFQDSRAPDFIAIPYPGVIYTTGSKLAEHGGFSDDDRNVMLMISAPNLSPATNAEPVETRQIAPTIMGALGLDAGRLQAVQIEGTQALPITLH